MVEAGRLSGMAFSDDPTVVTEAMEGVLDLRYSWVLVLERTLSESERIVRWDASDISPAS